MFKRVRYQRLAVEPNVPSLPTNTAADQQGTMSKVSATDVTEITVEELPPTITVSWFIYLLVVCVCIGGFLFGYDTGVISGAMLSLQDEFQLSTVQKELVVGATTFGAIFGGFFSGMFAGRIGRKLLVIISSVLFIVGALLLALAQNYATLLVGRLFVGLGVGAASMIVPVYISEIAPQHIRGRLTTLNTLIVTFGQVIAYVMNIAFANVNHGWRYMFGLAGIPALFQLVVMPFLPESPRHMVATGQTEKARTTLRSIYGHHISDQFVEQELIMISDGVEQNRNGKYRDFLLLENLKPLLVACLLQAAQQLSGFNTAMYYAATILQYAGFRSNSGSTSVAIIVAVTNMVFTAIAVFVVDLAGRRRMLVYTMLVMIAGLIALGACFAAQQGFVPKQDTCAGYATNCARCVLDDTCGWSISQSVCIPILGNENDIYESLTGCPPRSNDSAITGVLLTALVVYVASYALGLGYAPWLIQSEMFTLSLRGKANGISTAVNWICNLIISTTFLSMSDTFTMAGSFWFYAGISIILWIPIYRFVPETAKRSLEEVSAAARN